MKNYLLALLVGLLAFHNAIADSCATTITRGSGNVNIVGINLDCPNLKIIATDEKDKGMTVSEFAYKYNAKIAINGGFFRNDFQPFGLTVTKGSRWAKARDTINRSFLGCDKNNKCFIDPINNISEIRSIIYTAIPGWQVLNTKSWKFECALGESTRCLYGKFNTKQPRTAIGLDSKNSILYLVVVNGRLKTYQGLTLDELGEIFKSLHVDSALNLDGGGSSTLVIDGHRVSKLPDAQLTERVVADHVGFSY